MSHTTHDQHAHMHGEHCGHVALSHNDHVDYLHESHLHSPHEGHYDEHVLEVNAQNPSACAPIAARADIKVAGTKWFPTGITWTISTRERCIIHTAITAMTMDWLRFTETPSDESRGVLAEISTFPQILEGLAALVPSRQDCGPTRSNSRHTEAETFWASPRIRREPSRS